MTSAARDRLEVDEAVKRVADRLYRDNRNARTVDVFLDGVRKIAFIVDPNAREIVQVALSE